MRLYQSIRLFMYLFGLLVVGIFYWAHVSLSKTMRPVGIKQYFPEEANQKADAIYLNWRLTFSPELQKLLPDERKRRALVDITKSDFSHGLTSDKLSEQVDQIIDIYYKTVLKGRGDRAVLGHIVKLLVEPEIRIFVVEEADKTADDEMYHRLMDALEKERTAIGTNLRMNALRFLTSKALSTAIEMLPKFLGGQDSHDVSPEDKKKYLAQISAIITRHFMNNLAQLEEAYVFDVPEDIERVIQEKIIAFLDEKLFS